MSRFENKLHNVFEEKQNVSKKISQEKQSFLFFKKDKQNKKPPLSKK